MLQAPKYTKNQIDKAGKLIIKTDISPETKKQCIEIIDNWRASHAYPMNSISNTLKRKLRKYKDIITAQRLKRLDTILNKLDRYPEMNLSRMQDLGGCRVVFSSLSDLKSFRDSLVRSKINHILTNEKKYIKNPKPNTGYRGIHLVYKYSSSKMSQYNDLLVEIQLRTKLQHLWATAVETVGAFTHNQLKFEQGDDVWLRFFKLVSIIFAAEEEKKAFKSIKKIENHFEVVSELIELINKNKLTHKLESFRIIKPILNSSRPNLTTGYYLLRLNLTDYELKIEWYKETEEGFNEAVKAYTNLEGKKRKDEDVVLIATKDLRTLMRAYPNYFSDISEFNKKLFRFINNQLARCEKYIDKKSNEFKLKKD